MARGTKARRFYTASGFLLPEAAERVRRSPAVISRVRKKLPSLSASEQGMIVLNGRVESQHPWYSKPKLLTVLDLIYCSFDSVPPLPAGVKNMGTVRGLWQEEAGQDIAEYAVMLAVILVIVVGTIRLIGSSANTVFSSVASSIQ